MLSGGADDSESDARSLCCRVEVGELFTEVPEQRRAAPRSAI